MAWITFIVDHLIILYIVLYNPPVQPYEGIIATFFMLSGAILGAYVGFSSWDDISSRRDSAYYPRRQIDTESIDER